MKKRLLAWLLCLALCLSFLPSAAMAEDRGDPAEIEEAEEAILGVAQEETPSQSEQQAAQTALPEGEPSEADEPAEEPAENPAEPTAEKPTGELGNQQKRFRPEAF